MKMRWKWEESEKDSHPLFIMKKNSLVMRLSSVPLLIFRLRFFFSSTALFSLLLNIDSLPFPTWRDFHFQIPLAIYRLASPLLSSTNSRLHSPLTSLGASPFAVPLHYGSEHLDDGTSNLTIYIILWARERVSKRASEWAQWSAWAKQAVRRERTSEQCMRMSQRASKLPSPVLAS